MREAACTCIAELGTKVLQYDINVNLMTYIDNYIDCIWLVYTTDEL